MYTKTIVTRVNDRNETIPEKTIEHDKKVNEYIKKVLDKGLEIKVINKNTSNRYYLFLITTIQYSPANGIIE